MNNYYDTRKELLRTNYKHQWIIIMVVKKNY